MQVLVDNLTSAVAGLGDTSVRYESAYADMTFAKSALLTAIAALEAQVPQWQDIETAPKKGSFLAYATVEGFSNFFVCRWWKGDERNTGRWEGGHAQPTHWMPLPSSPTGL